MSRFAGLPCSKSSDSDRPSATRHPIVLRPTAARFLRAAASGTLGLALPLALGASSVLPVAPGGSAPAASFAVAGLLGATGDVAIEVSTDADRAMSGTLAFGDPEDP